MLNTMFIFKESELEYAYRRYAYKKECITKTFQLAILHNHCILEKIPETNNFLGLDLPCIF